MDILKAAANIIACGVIARLAWHTGPEWIPISLAYPALVFHQRSRGAAALSAFAYSGVASWPVAILTRDYFNANPLVALLPWCAATLILSSPWILLWSPSAKTRWWRIPTTLIVSIIPPIGLINWASPITAAGPLFPGLGIVGILATIVVLTAIATRNAALTAILAMLSLTTIATHAEPTPPKAWAAIDTHFGDIRHNEFQAAEFVEHIARTRSETVLILPEAMVPRWTAATELFWQPTIGLLQRRQATILLGASIPAPPDQRRNTAMAIGATRATLDQHIPVPLAMWRAWGANRAPLNLSGPYAIQIGRETASILICFEQLLPWSNLSALATNPTVHVGIANASWTKQTVVPHYQQAVLRCWARLFGKPALTATNY